MSSVSGYCIDLGKEADFVGRVALAAEAARGLQRGLIGLKFDIEQIVRLSLDARPVAGCGPSGTVGPLAS